MGSRASSGVTMAATMANSLPTRRLSSPPGPTLLSGKNCSPEKTARRAHSETTTQAKKLQKRVSQRITTNASPREQVTGRAHNNALDRMDRISELPNRSRFERVVDRFYWLDEQKLRKNCSTREQICAICQDNFNQDNHVKILPCRHMFHFKCLRRSVCIYRQNTCPNCRSEIPSRDIER